VSGIVVPILMTVLAGICFAIWPMVLQTSKLKGGLASVIFSFIVGAMIIPVVMFQGGFVVAGTLWSRVVIACVFGAAGLALFNTAMAQVKPLQAATLIVIVNVTQAAAIAAYSVYSNSAITSTQMIGFLFAGVAVYLLLK
jgi:hypothetical protein